MLLLCRRPSLTPRTRSPTSRARSLAAPSTVAHPGAGLRCFLPPQGLPASVQVRPGPDLLRHSAPPPKKGPVIFNPTKYMKDRDHGASTQRTDIRGDQPVAGAPLTFGWALRLCPPPLSSPLHRPSISPSPPHSAPPTSSLLPPPFPPHLSPPPLLLPLLPAQLCFQQQEVSLWAP